MSLKQEIETWVQALTHYDNNEFEESLTVFDNIADTSKILFNCGVIHATLGEHDRAVECFRRAIRLDQYLAVAYFQQGVSNFLVGDFEEALANFNDTLLYLRGNNYIDYEQLGLKFKLYSCEVLFNRGLCYIYLQQSGPGMKDFDFARKEKMTQDHDVIDDAIRENAEGYTVFSIPVGILYRPNDAKVKNLKTKNYLGQARLVAASDRSNAFTGFAGAELKAKIAAANSPPIGSDASVKELGSANDMPFATSNLVDRTISNRGRQQSEPPMNRNVFPPTPPPEADKLSIIGSDNGSVKGTTRAASVRSGDGRPGLRQPASQRNNTGFGRENPYSSRDDNGFPPRQDNGFQQRQDNGFPSRQGDGFPPRQDGFSSRNEFRPPPPFKGKQMGDLMRGPMDDRMRGPMDDRMRGPMDDRMRGPMDDRMRGPMDDRMRGPMDDRMRGPMDDRMGGPSRGGMDSMRGETEDRLGNLPRNQFGNANRSPMNMTASPPMNQSQMNPMDRPRLGNMRTASEPRGPSRQYPSTRSRDGGPNQRRPTLFRETTEESMASASSGPSGRGMQDPYGAEDDEYRDELFDMYSTSPRSSRQPPQSNMRRTRSNIQPNRPAYIPEEPSDEPYASDAYSDASLDSTSFDMMGAKDAPQPRRMPSRRPVEVKKIRVKVHANEDTRYIMIGPEIQMGDFERKIAEKFKLRGAVKIKIADEGDMVTMADHDDLDVVIQAAKSAARTERSDMGKMEVWIVGL